jgi:hypothetical protein
MTMLGDWNWYLPQPLQWLPRIRHDVERRPIMESAGD